MHADVRPRLDEILSRQPLFKSLSAEELAALVTGSQEVRATRGDFLFQKGDVPEGVHVVVSGQVKLSIPSSQGTEKVVHMFQAGSSFGEAMVFLDKPYPVCAQATQDSILVLVRKHTLLALMEDSTLLCRKMMASLSIRLHELLEDMETCTLRNSAHRVINLLCQLAAPHTGNSYTVQLPASKQNIASQLNLAPETLSRTLHHLIQAGLIQVSGRTIQVLDERKLKDFVTQ